MCLVHIYQMQIQNTRVSKLRIDMPRGVSQVMSYLAHHKVADPVIIGGCLRNKALGVNVVADVDVALHAQPDHVNERLFNILARINPHAVDQSKRHRGILSAQHSVNIAGVPADITFFSVAATAQEKAARARVGISALAMDASGTVWATDAFRRDRDNRTITLLDGTKGDIAPQIFQYAARLQRVYFPDFTIVDGTAADPRTAIVKAAITPTA